jgi:DNA mismatch repair protein MutL
MGKIRVLSDNLANKIAAGEVVERPASVAKELLENSLDAGARRILIEIEAGGRRLLKITDDGEGMTRDDAVLAFERHATSKIKDFEDLMTISTLGFRGEALASIASVARVELTTKTADDTAATKVVIEGGRLIDVKDAAHPTGTTLIVRDLFFNVPARRKFLRSEATENFHLINLITHYALAHPDKSFTLNNNGREAMRVAPARSLRERAYQIFGGEFIESLLQVEGGNEFVARISGFISAPRERRTNKDSQYFFINGRFVRDKIIARALTEGYRSILPHGVYPIALLFVTVPPEEVDVNVHPAKTEVRFRRPEAVREIVSEAIRQGLASHGVIADASTAGDKSFAQKIENKLAIEISASQTDFEENLPASASTAAQEMFAALSIAPQETATENFVSFAEIEETPTETAETKSETEFTLPVAEENTFLFESLAKKIEPPFDNQTPTAHPFVRKFENETNAIDSWARANSSQTILPPLDSAARIAKAIEPEDLTAAAGIRPLGQLHQSYIIAADAQGLLIFDQHVVHERILFDKFRRKIGERRIESQNLLLPETLDLTPAQAAAFDFVQDELVECGFGLMRLSGRTVAIKAVPSDLPASEARNLLREILETIDVEKRGAARDTWRDSIAASLACKAAVKINMPLTTEKMQWLIDKLLLTASPTTCPHGRPVILRLTMRDIERSFHRS